MLLKDPNSLLYYDDAVSHLVIARRIIDSVTPGIAQFGSVWLPMTHLLLLPLTASNYLFQTGLAGTIVSGISTAIAAVFLSKIVKLHFSSKYGFLAASLFLLNSSVVYMSLVPMMEAPFMMFFMMTAYYALNWYLLNYNGKDIWLQYRSLLKCGIAISAATLTRYEAWFFPIGLVLMILIVLLLGKKELWKRKIEAFVFIALPYSLLGIIVWTVYNGLIFRNPILFFAGPYSAQAQSLTRPYRHYLFLQPGNAISTLFSVASDMYGLHVVLLSILGASVFLYMKRKKSLIFCLLTLFILGFPTLLDLVAMIQGSGEIYRHIVTGWFNGRYLIFVGPLFAFSSTALVAFVASNTRNKILTGAAAALVLSFYLISVAIHPLAVGQTTALSDGKIMAYRGDIPYAIDIGKALNKVYHGGYIVDFTLSKSSPIIKLYSGIPLKEFIDVNNKEYWKESEHEPWTHVNYAILQKPVDHSNNVHINQSEYYDPVRENILYWNKYLPDLLSPFQPVGESLLSSVKIVYQNDNFLVLKNEHKDLVIEKFSDHLKFPSNIAIVGKDDILFAEKKTGVIHRVVDGRMLAQPVLDVNVATTGDRGVLGMAVANNRAGNSTYVFLYYTQSTVEDGDDAKGYREPPGNRLYRYQLVGNELVNPKLLLDLPVGIPDASNAGKVIVGPDKNIYVLVNNEGLSTSSRQKNGTEENIIINPEGGQIKLTNKIDNVVKPVDKQSRIIGITQDGKPFPMKVQGTAKNTTITSQGQNYSAFDIGDGHNMDFDPVTGSIWIAGYNNKQNQSNTNDALEMTYRSNSNSDSMVSFVGSLNPVNIEGKDISEQGFQKLTWDKHIGPTPISFVNSSKLGKQYENDFIVGDTNNGTIYDFDMDKNRAELFLNESLSDKVVNSDYELESYVLLRGLGAITDIETGDDGYLYFSTMGELHHDELISPMNDGAIYRLKAPGK
jgi:glucose/arabinose dehydrogenase